MTERLSDISEKSCSENGNAKINSQNTNKLNYSSYLQVDKLLSCQKPIECGKPAHDQMVFIITHQAHELWFKQILFEMDSIREMFRDEYLDEGKMLVLNNRLARIVAIYKNQLHHFIPHRMYKALDDMVAHMEQVILVEQITVLETMTALDFMEFRDCLVPASGIQSLQFRLIENTWGIREEHRVKYNQKDYRCPFHGDDLSLEQIDSSVKNKSMQALLQKWLERTPGLEKDGFNFPEKYNNAINNFLLFLINKGVDTDGNTQDTEEFAENLKRFKGNFDTVTNEAKYNFLLSRGERHFTHKAFQGAMMIAMYRDEPRFSQPFQMLNLLMDIDSLMTKWRHNHSILVQRLVGSKVGTAGSSGYHYLRSTVSDRYKPFLDLFNLSTYLVPREFIPPLSDDMKKRLNTTFF